MSDALHFRGSPTSVSLSPLGDTPFWAPVIQVQFVVYLLKQILLYILLSGSSALKTRSTPLSSSPVRGPCLRAVPSQVLIPLPHMTTDFIIMENASKFTS